jgi:FkbM family methyltransferase
MFDYNNMNLIKWLLKEGGIFFDIGANIGAYTLVASEQALARVYAFEPHPATFKLLTENIAINGRDNIKALNLALGNQEGTVDFLGEYGSPLNRVVADGHILQNTIKVPMRRAADICRDYNVSPDFVKVDVEGFEYEVLKGFDEYLRVIKLLFIEANEDPDSEESHSIARLLSDNGLKGPYFFDFNNLTFYNDRHGTKEDAVFISIHHLDTLGQNAFSIQSI